MEWLTGVEHFRSSRQPGVIVTVVSSRGHTPRHAGAKMAISPDATWGSVGGGNLEATAIKRARQLLEARITDPEMITLQLSDKAPAEHGIRCCGGEVTMLIEPVRLPAAVAIFGVGHVGLELARILARSGVELHLVDSRAAMLTNDRLAVLDDANADIRAHHEPIPETALSALPQAAHILIMTHDHAEDAALCDAALRTPSVATIGLIGSQSKWRRFQKQLREVGHSDDAIDRIQTPIGIPGITSKEPAAIAVAVAAGFLQTLESADAA